MNNNEKVNARVLFVLTVIFVTFSVAAFAIPFRKDNGTFWVAYSSEVIAIFLQFVVFKTAFGKGEGLRSRVLGYPIARVGYTYLAIQSVVTLLFFILSTFIENFPVGISIAVCAIILGIAVVCGVVTDSARDVIEQIDQSTKTDIANMKMLQAQSRAMVAMATEPDIKKQMEQLADKFRFSDPVSAPELKALEEQLRVGLEELKVMLRDHAEGIPQRIEFLSRTLEERNIMCKTFK